MIKIIVAFLLLVILFGGVSYTLFHYKSSVTLAKKAISLPQKNPVTSTPTSTISSPLAIASMREKTYPGSVITIEQTVTQGVNYKQYVASYMSDGLKIYGLVTIPIGNKPTGGWPVILFNHGYIPPASYSTQSSYQIMVAPLAAAGFIVFKPDYRGNGNSHGIPTQPYITPDYVTDSMNALSSIKKFKDANPQKIGVFGHSMGGNISLHEIELTHDIKAVELMAGVVGNETQLADWWNHRYAVHSIVGNDLDTYFVFEKMIQENGTPDQNASYWDAIDPTKFTDFITSPVQIQVGSADEDVPVNFSTSLNDLLSEKGKTVDFHLYPGANHNLVPDTTIAMNTTVSFFEHYLK